MILRSGRGSIISRQNIGAFMTNIQPAMRTPLTQFGLNGLGTTDIGGTASNLLQKAEDLISQNPLPVLCALVYFVFIRR